MSEKLTPAQLQEEVWQRLQQRMEETYSVSQVKNEDSTFLTSRLQTVAEEARLYFRYHIPAWPPKMLLRKIIRRLFLPLILPQTVVNEAVRDVLIELQQRSERQTNALQESQQTVSDLEEQVYQLRMQVEVLARSLETPPTRFIAENGVHNNAGGSKSNDGVLSKVGRV